MQTAVAGSLVTVRHRCVHDVSRVNSQVISPPPLPTACPDGGFPGYLQRFVGLVVQCNRVDSLDSL